MKPGEEGHSAIDDYYMPPLDVKTVDDQGIENLKTAIVMTACKDYVNVCKELTGFKNMEHKDRKYIQDVIRKSTGAKVKLQEFFRSSWFTMLAGEAMNGDKVMDLLEYNTPDRFLTPEERKARDERDRKANGVPAGECKSEVRPGQGSGEVSDDAPAPGKKVRKRAPKGKDHHTGAADGQMG